MRKSTQVSRLSKLLSATPVTGLTRSLCVMLLLLASPLVAAQSQAATLTFEVQGIGIASPDGSAPDDFIADPGDVLPLGGANLIISTPAEPFSFGFTSPQFPSRFTFTVANTGNETATDIAFSFFRGASSFFSFFSPTGECTTSLGAGASCAIGVIFTPVFDQSVNDFLVIDYNENFALTPVPLPAALPLFAGGLGLLGLLGWRRSNRDA